MQYCPNNCSKLKTVKAYLQKTIVYVAHKDDNQMGHKDDDDCFDVNEIAEMFQHLDDMGVRDVDPKQHSLKIIAEEKRPQQEIRHSPEQLLILQTSQITSPSLQI